MALSASDLASITSSLATWELIEYASTAVVIVGVIGEYIADFTKFAERRGIERSLSKKSCLVLIVGLVFELMGLVQTSQLSGRIIEDSRSSIEEARKEAAVANERASRNEKEAARLRAEAQPRDLTQKQRDEIKRRFVRFKGQRVFVSSYAGDTESLRYALQISQALLDAGADPATLWGGIGLVPTGAIRGSLIIGVHTNGKNDDGGLSDLLTKWLKTTRVDGERTGFISDAPPRIMVGVKPFPPSK